MTTTRKEESKVLVNVISKYLGTQIVSAFGAVSYLSKKSIMHNVDSNKTDSIRMMPMDLTTDEFTDMDLLYDDIVFEVRTKKDEQKPSRLGISKFLINFPFIPDDLGTALSFIYQYRIIVRLAPTIKMENSQDQYQLGTMIRSLKALARKLSDEMEPVVENLLNQLNINYFINSNGELVRTCNTMNMANACIAGGLTVNDGNVDSMVSTGSVVPIVYEYRHSENTNQTDKFAALLSNSGVIYHFTSFDNADIVFVSELVHGNGNRYYLYTKEKFNMEFKSISEVDDVEIKSASKADYSKLIESVV